MSDGAQHLPLELTQREAMRALVKVLSRQTRMSYRALGEAAGVDGEWVHRYANQRNRAGGRRELSPEDKSCLQRLHKYMIGLDRTTLLPDANAFLGIVLNEHRDRLTGQHEAYRPPEPLQSPPRRIHDFFPIPIFPLPISERDAIGRLDIYEGTYLCYYDLNRFSEKPPYEPVIYVREYKLAGYDERDGSLVGEFRAANTRRTSLTDGLLKFVIAPQHQNTFYVMEIDVQRETPPVSGIIRGIPSTLPPYFYGMLMGFRLEGQAQIVAVKCLILKKDSIASAGGGASIPEGSFMDEVREEQFGKLRWNLLKRFLNGTDEHDGRQCLHTWSEFVPLGENKKASLTSIVREIYSSRA